MLPFLKTEVSSSAGPGAEVLCVPPPRFKPLRGSISEVQLRLPPYSASEGGTWAQKNGLRYEAKVQAMVVGEFPGYLPGPCIHFKDNYVMRMAQPDGILVFDDFVVVVEIKYQHMPEAWWQLDQLYKPLIAKLWPQKQISLIEICRSYDPSMPFPVPIKRFDALKDWCSQYRSEFGVLVWRH